MREALGLLDEVTSRARATDAPPAVLVERPARYQELARQRATVLHARWSSTAGLADALRPPPGTTTPDQESYA
jgi:hypothetical protein